jgi:hypothetical protein
LEREKTIAQNQIASESVSSIYHCFDGQIRYSGSEPINTNNIAALENQFKMKSKDVLSSDDTNNGESKTSIPYKNNFERSSTLIKENDGGSASIIKDNQVNISGSSSNNSQTHNNSRKQTTKKKILASSDSDFFSLLRYNSEKLKKINCFSVSSSHSNNNNNNNNNKPKNMIYALSDSDFLIGINEKNKKLNLNNDRKSQAIANKSDIFNFLINQKSIDYKNLLDNNAQNNHHHNNNNKNHHHHHHHQLSGSLNNNNNNSNNLPHLKSLDIDLYTTTSTKKHFDDPEFLLNMQKLKAVFGEESAAEQVVIDGGNSMNEEENKRIKIIESISLNDGEITSIETFVDCRNQKNETVSLPPIIMMNTTNNDPPTVLNNSPHNSIDTVTLNIKNNQNSDKCSLSTTKSPLTTTSLSSSNNGIKCISSSVMSASKSLNNDDANNVLSQNNNSNLFVSTENIKKSNLSNTGDEHFLQLPTSHTTTPFYDEKQSQQQQQHTGDGNLKCYDVMNPVALDDSRSSVERRKRTPSTVTYNVNVINFQADDDTDTISGYCGGERVSCSYGAGKRSNSSTSE